MPENKGQIFSQQVMPPSEVYWPMMTSRKNTGRPLPNRKIKYGMRNAPANEQRREGEAVSVTVWSVRRSLPSPPNKRYQRSEGFEHRGHTQTVLKIL